MRTNRRTQAYNRLSKKTKVTVIMTTYNSSKTVEGALNSISKQTYPNIELIIIDDASTDNTVQLIERFIKKNKRLEIKLFRAKKNCGTYFCRNYAITKSTGTYITGHDSDDTCSPVYLDALMKPHLMKGRNSNLKVTQVTTYRRGNQKQQNAGGIRCAISACYRKTLISDVGFFDSVRFAADSEWRLRVQRIYGKDSVITVSDKVLYFASSNEDGLTRQTKTGLQSEARKLYGSNFRNWHLLSSTNHLKRAFREFPLKTDRPFDVHEESTRGMSGIKLDNFYLHGVEDNFQKQKKPLTNKTERAILYKDKLENQMNYQFPSNFDITKAEDVNCKHCGANVYETVVTLKKVPADVSPTKKPAVVPIPIFKCCSCGELNREYYQS